VHPSYGGVLMHLSRLIARKMGKLLRSAVISEMRTECLYGDRELH
jgi:hypothetical protein